MMPLGYADAYELLMRGSRALERVEANGMRLDVRYLATMIDESAEKIREFESDLKETEIWREWKKVYGHKANLGARDQLGHVLFDIFGFESSKSTASGKKASTDEDTLEKLDVPFVKRWLTTEKLKKARSTNLVGLHREQVGGFLHPVFNLHTVITYRSSATDPNSQNIPVRDKRLAKLVRTAFIPRSSDYSLLEIDMSGAEVRVATCYHKDPTMIDYIRRNHDFHMDLACQCYLLKPDEVTKNVRGTAKADFVFSGFYGDWFIQQARNLWEAITVDRLATVAGVGLREHLASKGITELGSGDKNPIPGTFEAHIKDIYDDFWGRRFPVYAQWKKDFFEEYLRKGYYQTLTGFICRGLFKRNEAINYPIQGSSFHCLLWSLIQLDEWLTKYNMKTKIIGQIHDSIIFDAHKSEMQDVLYKSHEVMINDIRKAWDWIIVPLEVDAEASDVNWYQKQKVHFPQAV